MQQVSKGWYRLHWILWVIINVTLLFGYIISRQAPDTSIQTTYGFNDAVLYMSIGILVYLFSFYWLISRASTALATFISSMMIVLQFMNLFNETALSSNSLIYIIMWLIVSWLVGMHGFAILLGAMLVTFIYLLLEIEFNFSNMESTSLFLAIGSIVVVVFGYYFWRNRFITPASRRVNQLSDMLRSNKQQSEILMESIDDGIIVTDTKGKTTLINQAGSKLTGWPEKEAIGFDAKTILRLIKDEKTQETIPDSEHPFSLVLKKHEHVNDTLQLFNREDKKIFISVVISPVILPKTKELVGTIAVFRDVSREKEEEQQRAEFISTASHEMRTPVAAIEGYLALALNDKVSKIDDKAREYLEKAHASTQNLGKLFQDLLTSAKAEDGRLSSHPTVTEMSKFAQQLSEDLQFGAKKKGLDVEFVINNTKEGGVIDASGGSVSKNIQPLYYAYVDPDRIREVITNLFDNAVKYTEKGRVSLGITGNDQVVQIRVSDTGHGIPQEDLPHLFQKFYRVDNSATRTVGGTGLGLFICRKIVELYNGHIWAESKEGEGSTFYINLPRVSSQRASQLQTQEAAASPLDTNQPVA
jgi:PAS domain S-box-containing protein